MSRARLNVFLERLHAERLEEFATLKGVSKSSIVAAALAAYVSPEGATARTAALSRRLEMLSRQVERLERDQTVLLEALGLWIRHQLAVTAPIPGGMQDVARAQGRARFADFVTQLSRHLQRGGSLVKDVWHEIAPEESREASDVPSADASEELSGTDENTLRRVGDAE